MVSNAKIRNVFADLLDDAHTFVAQGHGGSFTNVLVSVAGFTPNNSPYAFVAQAPNGAYDEVEFTVPCDVTNKTHTPHTKLKNYEFVFTWRKYEYTRFR